VAECDGGEDARLVALLDVPQPLGFLPTHQFWGDPENRRLAAPVAGTILVVSLFAVMVLFLEAPLGWAGFLFLALVATVVLVHGLFERFIRRAAERRSREHCKGLTDGSDVLD
jgi:hypothetical protein